jgi:hypothetical protein
LIYPGDIEMKVTTSIKFVIPLACVLAVVGTALAHAPIESQTGSIAGQYSQTQKSALPVVSGNLLTYQGRLADKKGIPLNSPVTIVFRIYDDAANVLWTSITRTITLTNGLFTVYLGDTTAGDPILSSTQLGSAASIGVTVGDDTEMSPRLSINSVVGHSSSGDVGVLGSSQTGIGVQGVGGAIGVMGSTSIVSGSAVSAINNANGPALEIQQGTIKVKDAGYDTPTTVFIHQITQDNLCNNGVNIVPWSSSIDNPLINGDPTAILIITPNSGLNSDSAHWDAEGMPAVVYDDNNSCNHGAGKWAMYLQNSNSLTLGSKYNIVVIKR